MFYNEKRNKSIVVKEHKKISKSDAKSILFSNDSVENSSMKVHL